MTPTKSPHGGCTKGEEVLQPKWHLLPTQLLYPTCWVCDALVLMETCNKSSTCPDQPHTYCYCLLVLHSSLLPYIPITPPGQNLHLPWSCPSTFSPFFPPKIVCDGDRAYICSYGNHWLPLTKPPHPPQLLWLPERVQVGYGGQFSSRILDLCWGKFWLVWGPS